MPGRPAARLPRHDRRPRTARRGGPRRRRAVRDRRRPLRAGVAARAPVDAGADIVTGEGRGPRGARRPFGGPSVGLFAARQQYLRQMPGRIVGRTKELATLPGHDTPRTGYVLTLQAREQFIRPRNAPPRNVSTAQALIAPRLHHHRAGAWPARPARGRRAVLPARARRRGAHRGAAGLRGPRARAVVPGVPRARPRCPPRRSPTSLPRAGSPPGSTCRTVPEPEARDVAAVFAVHRKRRPTHTSTLWSRRSRRSGRSEPTRECRATGRRGLRRAAELRPQLAGPARRRRPCLAWRGDPRCPTRTCCATR